METKEIHYVISEVYMETYMPLVYVVLFLALGVFINFGMVILPLLPGLYLFMQWWQFKKKAGMVVLIISERGIKNSWADMEWQHIHEARIEEFMKKRDLTFIHQIGNEPERVYRYGFNEIDISPVEYYSLVNQFKPVEVVTQTHLTMRIFGISSSIILWLVALWALVQPVKTDFQILILGIAAVVFLVHLIEVSFYFWHPRMRRHLSAVNIGMTMLVGVYHFMPLYKSTAEDMP
ncbi:hypothetical protein BH09BAC1_BH09BAC1_03430 [soil metagenome]